MRVRLKNYRSYSDSDWTVPNGLTLIDGANLSGKSNLFDSIFWCRYGWLPRNEGPKGGPADSVIRRKDGVPQSPSYVILNEKIGQDEIEIKRERPHKLTVKKNGEVLHGIDQAGLDELLGMTASRFLVSVYMSQKRNKSFYLMNDAERTELLSVVAGLEEIDRALETCKEKKKICETQQIRLQSITETLSTQLGEIPQRIQRLQSQRNKDLELANQQETRLGAIKKEKEQLVALLNLKKDADTRTRTEPLLIKIAAIKQELESLLGGINGLRQSLIAMPQIEDEFIKNVVSAREAVSLAKKKEQEIKDIERSNERIKDKMRREIELAESSRAGKCSQCKQELPEWDRNRETLDHLKKAEELKNQIKEVPATPDVSLLEKTLEETNERYLKRKNELEVLPSELKSKISVFEAQIKQKQTEESALNREIISIKEMIKKETDHELYKADSNEKQAEVQLAHLRASLKTSEMSLIDAELQASTLEQLVTTNKNSLKETNDSMNEFIDLIELFGAKGFRSICYDGMINRISDRSGQLLKVMTNDVYSTYLNQVTEDSKGNQKLILKPIIVKHGQEVPRDDLSGGGVDRVSLAYDVAVSEMAGENMPLFLDEVFTALDAQGKEDAMTLLEEVAKQRPVLVIDHTSEFKLFFNNIIKVVYENEESRLE